jgi:hypothetical protein
MKRCILPIVCLLISSIISTAVYAERACNLYQEKHYTDLIARAEKGDRDAMLELSTMYCDDCTKTLDSCVKDAVKWLKVAAAHGQPEAKRLMQGTEHETLHGRILYRSQNLKDGNYVFRSYHDNIGYIAYYEILKKNKIVNVPDAKELPFHGQFHVTEYDGNVFDTSLFGDHYPTLQINLSIGSQGEEGEMRYFSLGKELKCLIDKKTLSPYWTFSRFKERYSSQALDAFKKGDAELRNCEEAVEPSI